MFMEQLTGILKNYISIGLALSAGIVFFTLFGYYVVYKKLLNGKNTIPLQRILLIIVGFVYVFVLLGVVFFIREGGLSSNVELNLFDEYREAISTFSSSSWGYLILNILLFVPMGILLPLLFNKFKSFWKLLFLTLVVTLSIESIQLITKRGIFSVDDIFNNVLGSLIGYGIVLSILTLRSNMQHKTTKILKYLSPLIVALFAFAFIFISYSLQEFGNMQKYIDTTTADTLIHKSLSDLTQISTARSSADIYLAKVTNKKNASKLANKIFSLTDESISDSFFYSDSIGFRSDKNSNLNVIFLGSIYHYSTEYQEEESTNSSLDESFVRQFLTDFGATITDEMDYSINSYGEYILKADMVSVNDSVFNGTLTCVFNSDETIQLLTNQMIESTYVGSAEIISSSEALELAKKKAPDFDEYGVTFIAEAFSIEYSSLDTKGFLQPTYVFYDYKEDSVLTISVPALVK